MNAKREIIMNQNIRTKKLTVTVAGLAMMICVGILYMWSVFQSYVVGEHGWVPSQVAMTSSVMIAVFVLGNIIGGLLQEKIHPRLISLTGCVLFALGISMTSLVSTPGMLYFTYGVLGGFGCGLVYCTVLAVLQKWWAANTGLITGLTVGFFGLSVVVLSPVAHALLAANGTAYTFRFLGILFGVIIGLASLFMEKPSKEYYMAQATRTMSKEEMRQVTPRMMVTSPPYWFIFLSLFASSGAYLMLVPFISTIAVSRGMSTGLALIAVMITGLANALGRIVAPAVSDKMGRTNTMIVCYFISAAACIWMIFASGIAYIVAVFLIAFAYGGTSGINPVVVTELFGARNSGANYGLVLASLAVSSICFSMVSKALSSLGDFTASFIVCAAVCIVPITCMRLLHVFCKKQGKLI